MTLPSPNLDDRTFDELVAEALDLVRRKQGEWTDLSVNDPGVALIEVFAHLSELMLYRMNRLPDKAYVAFLELLGVSPHPPSAAQAELVFTLDKPDASDTSLPAGLTVEVAGSTDGSAPVAFRTLRAGTIPAGETEIRLTAAHALSHRGELVGRGTGQPGQRLKLRNHPVLADDLPDSPLIVAVEAKGRGGAVTDATLDHDGRAFTIWTEVSHFSPETAGERVFTIDRYLGELSFAPAQRLAEPTGTLSPQPSALGAAPPAGAEIRVWYHSEAAGSGRVAPGKLSVLSPPIPGISVRNPKPSIAGRPAESLEHALQRGPMSLHSLDRAITARDFETLARRASAGVNRARAIADASLWSHGQRGAVNVTLVPEIDGANPPVSVADLETAQHASVLAQVQAELDARRALGTSCLVGWAKAKTVRVKLRVDLTPGQDQDAVIGGIRKRLDALLHPLSTGPDTPGWTFGRSLFSWDVLRAVGDVPGVAGLSNIRLCIDNAPDKDTLSLSRDAYQPSTWYTGSGPELFRSGNDGASWEVSAHFEGQNVVLVDAYPVTSGDLSDRAGLVVAVTHTDDTSQVHLSRDCGQSFEAICKLQADVTSLAWVFRDRIPSLLLATRTGLFEVLATPGAAPRQIVIDEADPTMGISSVAVSLDLQGSLVVAVSGAGEQGVYLSSHGGIAGTFQPFGLGGELVRVLMIQHTATQRWLWAGVSAIGNDAGNGCYRLRLQDDEMDAEGWQSYRDGWNAGGCRSLTHDGTRIYAGSLRRGVLVLDPDGDDPAWRTPDVSCGLPLRDVSRLEPVDALSAAPGLVMAGGPRGVFRSSDLGVSYQSCSEQDFENEVRLPTNWIFCPGTHEIEIGDGDE